MSQRRAKVNAAKLFNAIIVALDGVKSGAVTFETLTGEVATVMGREKSDIEGAIKTQANNTSSPDAKRAVFKKIVEKCGLSGGQGAPRDNTDWDAAAKQLEALLAD